MAVHAKRYSPAFEQEIIIKRVPNQDLPESEESSWDLMKAVILLLILGAIVFILLSSGGNMLYALLSVILAVVLIYIVKSVFSDVF